MRVLVTGAAGFIGSHLVDRLLEEGEEVLGIDDLSSGSLANLTGTSKSTTGKFSFSRIDIRSDAIGDFIARNRPEVIFHLAAQVDVRKSVVDPVHDAMINVMGTLNILSAAEKAGTKKVVFTSSGGAIYGEPGPERLPVREDQLFLPESMPESPYGVSKRVMLDYLRYFKKVKDIDYAALALANVYGPRQEPAAEVGLEGQVVAIFSRNMLAKRPCTIYGDGTQTRDFVYVDDVVSAFIAARDKGSGELINVGSGVETSVNELFERLSEITGNSLAADHAPARAGEIDRIAIDFSKATQLLGWMPQHHLADGLKHTVAYFRANPKI